MAKGLPGRSRQEQAMSAFIKKHFRLILLLYWIGFLLILYQRLIYPDSIFWLLVWNVYRGVALLGVLYWFLSGVIDAVRNLIGTSPNKKGTAQERENAEKRTKAEDPNTTPQELFTLASDFPKEVSNNPVLPLLSLEDPSFYESLLTRINANLSIQEIKEKCAKLDGEQLRNFSADCAEHAVDKLEEHLPDEKRPRRMIALARIYAGAIWQHRAFSWEKRRSLETLIRFIEGDASEEEVKQNKATAEAQLHLFEKQKNSILEEIRIHLGELPRPQNPGHLVIYLATKAVSAAAASVCGYGFYTAREAEEAIVAAARITHARLPAQQRDQKIEEEKQRERQWQVEKLDGYLKTSQDEI
jgi:hypothetical protein